jgi:TPP-dependent pyruvate/acetoin dehydrogenase alpha subunit
MLKCRTVEERIRIVFWQSRFSDNYFSAVGQETTEVGTTVDLLPEDTIAQSLRNFVTHIMKGDHGVAERVQRGTSQQQSGV